MSIEIPTNDEYSAVDWPDHGRRKNIEFKGKAEKWT
jgi:hypothetical protein